MELNSFLYTYSKENGLQFACTPMNYPEKMPVIIPDRPEWSYETIAQTKLTTKALDWSYEEEWRFIIWGKADLKVTIPDGIISEVILGCQIPEDDERVIKELLRGKNTRIILKKARKSLVEFKLEFMNIEY